ncbi:hypothetical protein KQI88_00040 [Alkaliphilus sp. MSJ-5]|uniref:YbbR domain-containing protein n=1 Tax=Alkaliphilus flagellatus TaxID=2841507 RepID=A0ABS6FZJ1_9FIRM|nr:CdaR family protein [Alkaliphilus flagellatus]MBU5674803.1 hypothetical protein [Alkaliphilus flagellatus]
MNKTGIRNLAPKIISILFALVLWVYVMSVINPRVSRDLVNVPVKLVNLEELKAQGLVLVGSEDFRVRVRLTGRRDEVFKISPEQIQIKADLRGYKLGVNNVPLEISAPNNIGIDVSPRFIRVELEEITKKQRDVKVLITGSPKKNYVVGNLDYKPTAIWIEGPESYVNSVENVVAKLDVTGETKNLLLSLPLKPVNSRGEEVPGVEVKTAYVDVSLSIDLLKSVPIKPDLQVTTGDGHVISNVEINPKEVILKGQEEILKGITEITTDIVQVENLTTDQVIETKLKLPQGVTLQEEVPITVSISLQKVEEETYKIPKDKIIFNNLNEKLKVDKNNIPESVDVKVVALRSVLDSIKESDISIEVDLKELTANEYTIEPVVQLPFTIEKDVKELQLNPETINIKLVEKK